MATEKEEFEEFEPFEEDLKEAVKKMRSALSYEEIKAIGIQQLHKIAKQIPKSFGVKCILTKGKEDREEICFIDRGETYADTLIFRPSKSRKIFVVGAWGDYIK